jgi:hypothetical protein
MITDSIGVHGNDYLQRAVIAQILLTANQPEDAIYPLIITDADGKPPVGEARYVLHFDKGKLPPVHAFWSLSMYDAQGFQVANPINRFAIGDRDPLKYNADGSLDLYVQHDNPGGDKTANWLPSPSAGVLGLTMRLYAPVAQVRDGSWRPQLCSGSPDRVAAGRTGPDYRFNDWLMLYAGYRHLHINWSGSGLRVGMALSGPFLDATFQF